jgi:transposase-like protein
MTKKIHGNQTYAPELIKKAVKMYKTGKHSLKDVCDKFGIKATTTLRYHASKEGKEKIKASYKKWRTNNLESSRKKMREYARKKKHD